MKKIFIFVGILLLGIIVGTVSFDNSSKVKAVSPTNEVSFVKQGYIKEMNDNWIYFFDILSYDNQTNKYYVFDGYNMKYSYLKDYSIKMVNPENQEVVDKIISDTPILSRSDDFGEEITNIGAYFTKKQFEKEINLDDLYDLETNYISKDLLVEMFNHAFNSNVQRVAGKYAGFSHLIKEFVDSTSDKYRGEWELTLINDYGYLKNVTIDLKLEDGSYISETGEYNKIISSIEKNIENSQSFDKISLDGLPFEMKDDLSKLLEKINYDLSV